MRNRIIALIMSVALLGNVSELSYITAYAEGTQEQSSEISSGETQSLVEESETLPQENGETTIVTEEGSSEAVPETQETQELLDTQASPDAQESQDAQTQPITQEPVESSSTSITTPVPEESNSSSVQEEEADLKANTINQEIPADTTIVYTYEDITLGEQVTVPTGVKEKFYRFIPAEDGWYDLTVGNEGLYNLRLVEFNSQTSVTSHIAYDSYSDGLLTKLTAGNEYLYSFNKNQSSENTLIINKMSPVTEISVTSPTVNSICGETPQMKYNGMTLTINHEDNSQEIISDVGMYPDMRYKGQSINISYGDSRTTPGVYTATVSFFDKTATMDVTLVENSLTKLEILSNPTNMTYYNNTEYSWMNLNGLGIRTYEGDTAVGDVYHSDSTNVFNYTLLAEDGTPLGNSFSNLVAGDYNVRYTYKGCSVSTTDKPFHLLENNISSIEIVKAPYKTTFIDMVDTYFNTAGMELKINYKNGTSEIISFANLKNYSTTIEGTVNDFRLLSPSDQPYHMVIKYMNQSVTQDFYIKSSPVKDVKIVKMPTKTTCVANAEYYQQLSGLEIDVTYKDGSTERVSYGQMSKDGYSMQADNNSINWNTTGTQKASIAFMGYTAEYSINILENTVTSINVNKQPNKIEYIKGVDTGISYTGMTLDVTYSNGDIKTITPSGSYLQYNYENNMFSTIGTKKINITYYGAKTSFDITVIEDPIQSIAVSKMPTKTDYVVSAEKSINLSGIELTLIYKTGEQKVIKYSGEVNGYWINYNMAGIDFDTVGEKTIPITFMGKTSSIKINVVDNPVKSIKFESLPRKITYIAGVDKYINTSGIVVKAEDNNGNQTRIYNYSTSSIDWNKIGTQTVTITYMNRTATFDIEIVENSVTEISVAQLPVKTKYVIDYETDLDLDGLKLEVLNMNKSEVVDYGDTEDYSISADDNNVDWSTLGMKQVTVRYMGQETTFDIEVIDNPVKSISINTQNTPKTYYAGVDSYVFGSGTGISVQYKENSGIKDVIYDNLGELDGTELHFRTIDAGTQIPKDITTGTYPVIVSYMGVTASYNINVVPVPVSSIEIISQPDTKEFYEFESSDNFDLKGLKFRIHFNNGKEPIDVSYTDNDSYLNGYWIRCTWKYMQAEIDEDYPSLGNNAIIVTYMGVEAEIPVTVLETPVKSIEVITKPSKVYNALWDMDGDELWSENIDLSGLELKITYADNSVKNVIMKTDDYGNSRKVDEQYNKFISASGVSNSNQIRLYYMNQTTLFSYTTQDPNWQDAIAMSQDVPVVSNIEKGDNGLVYKFIPTVSDTYKFYSYGGINPNGFLFDENKERIYCNNEGDNGFSLSTGLTAGKTYYLAINAFTPCTFHVVVSKESSSTINTKTAILNIPIEEITTPKIGEKPDVTGIIKGHSECSIKTISWTGLTENSTFQPATKYTVNVTLKAQEGFQFTTATAASINGNRVISRKYNSDGTFTITYLFDYTDCQIVMPSSDKYAITGEKSVGYGSDYTFSIAYSSGETSSNYVIKANGTLLTADSNGKFTLPTVKENQKIVVKSLSDISSGNGVFTLSFYNKGNIYDKLNIAQQSKVASLPAPENILPVLNSTDTQFFLGWYDNKGVRFTSNTLVTSDKDLTAKWCDRIITSTYNGYTIYYKILSIDANNQVKVQVGTGNGLAVQQAIPPTNANFINPLTAGNGEVVSVPSGFMSVLDGNQVNCDVTAVADNAFSNSTATSIVLPQTIQSIGTGAFSGCTSLTSMVVPESVQTIEPNTFSGCTALMQVTLPTGTLAIEDGAFGGCSSLGELTIPSTLQTLSSTAFAGAGSTQSGTEFFCSSDVTSVLSGAGIASDKIIAVTITLDYEYSDLTLSKGKTKVIHATAVEGTTDVSNQISWTTSNDSTVSLNTLTGGSTTLTGKQSSSSPVIIGATYKGVTEAISVNVLVTKINIETDNSVVVSDIGNQTYNASAHTPVVSISKNGSALILNTDYGVAYTNNKNAGTATITITGKGNYEGTVTKQFTINKENVSNCSISDVSSQMYNGSAISPSITLSKGNVALTQNTDYEVAYTNNTNAGTATITITGKGNYEGTVTKQFTINKENVSNCSISDVSSQMYNGSAISPSITLSKGNVALTQNTDYEVAYTNNTNAGTATITITGKGNYEGTATKQFSITAINIDNATVDSISDLWYTGAEQQPVPKVVYANAILAKDMDYSLSYSNNKNAGVATLTITGKGNYGGSKNITFKIISSLDKVTNLSAVESKEKSIGLTWTNVSCASGYEIYIYKDAKKQYVKLGTSSQNSYTSKKLTAGTSYKYKVRAYIKVNGKNVYGKYSDILKTGTCTKKPSIGAKLSKKNAIISWKKVAGASGYEIYMSTSKNGTYSKTGTITKGSTVTYTKKNLVKGQTYFFKVRTYSTINKIKIYSDYSSIKSVKVK